MLAAALVVFVVVLAIILGAYAAFVARPEAVDHARLRKRMQSRREAVEEDTTVVERPAGIERPQIDAFLSKGGLTRPIELTLERSGMATSVSTLLAICAGAGLVGALAMARLSPNPMVGVPLGLCAAWLPYAFVRARARKRLSQFEEQFPEAIELIARALRAGHAFTTGLALVAEELPDPVGSEFRLVYDRQNFGMPIGDALHVFAERVPLLDARLDRKSVV